MTRDLSRRDILGAVLSIGAVTALPVAAIHAVATHKKAVKVTFKDLKTTWCYYHEELTDAQNIEEWTHGWIGEQPSQVTIERIEI